MNSVAGYTRFVSLARRFLWVLIAGLIALVFWISSNNGNDDNTRIVFSGGAKSEALQNEMLKPHFQGMDDKDQPYTVIADKATQLDKDTVQLENIRADMLHSKQSKESWMALNAGSGELHMEKRHMTLTGGVNLFYDGGYEFRSDHAQVDIAQGSAYGDSPIEGQGPMGTLKADRFEVEQRGKVLRFNGSVRMKIYPR